jgi:hypothetical protein
MGRDCPDCGELLKISVEHVTVLRDEPAIAAPRWDRELRLVAGLQAERPARMTVASRRS